MQNIAPKVIDMVKDKQVTFQFYRNGQLIYHTECGFEFSVPVSDTGDAAFNAVDKATLFMRWIRRAVKEFNQQQELIEQCRQLALQDAANGITNVHIS